MELNLEIVVATLISMLVLALVFRVVLGTQVMIRNQKSIMRLLEGIYKQNGGKLEDLEKEE